MNKHAFAMILLLLFSVVKYQLLTSFCLNFINLYVFIFLVTGKKGTVKGTIAWHHCSRVNENKRLHLRCKYCGEQG